MKAVIFSMLAAAAVVAADDYAPSTTSTVYATSVYTITSCAPEKTDCPAKLGQVTTDLVSMYTTVCAVKDKHKETAAAHPIHTAAPHPYPTKDHEKDDGKPYATSTYYSTVEYTITSCAPEVTYCPIGKKTSDVYTSTSICSTADKHYTKDGEYTTSTIYKTHEYTITSCKAEVTNCPYGKKTADVYTTTTVCPVSKATHAADYKTYAPVSPPKSVNANVQTVTYSTCVPSTYTKVVTVYPTSTPAAYGSYTTYAASPKGTGSAAAYPVSSPKNGTYVPYVYGNAAPATKAGGLLAALGLAAAALL